MKNGVILLEKPKQLPAPPTLSGVYSQTCVPFLQAIVKYYSDNNIPYHLLAQSLADGSHLPQCEFKTKLFSLNQISLVATAASRMELYQPFIKLNVTDIYDLNALRYIIADLLIMYIEHLGDPTILTRTLDDHISSIVVKHDSMGQIPAENLSMMILQVRSLFAMKTDPNEDLIKSLKHHIQRILNHSTRAYIASSIWTNMTTYLDIHSKDIDTNMSREEAISLLFTQLEMYCYTLQMNTLKEPVGKLSTGSSNKESSNHNKSRQGNIERDNHGRFVKSSTQYMDLSAVLDELFIDPSIYDAELLDKHSQEHSEDTENEINELYALMDGNYKDMPDRACLDSLVPTVCCGICGLNSCMGSTPVSNGTQFPCKLIHPDKKNTKGEPLILLGVYAGMHKKEVLDASLNCAIKRGWLQHATPAEIESVKAFISETQARMGISYNNNSSGNTNPSTYNLGYNARIRPNYSNYNNNRPSSYRSPFQDHRDRWNNSQSSHYGPNAASVSSVRFNTEEPKSDSI
jgi:hypothetical protein